MGQVLAIPLGGLGEIGLNALALEAAAGLVLVDCGLMVQDQEFPGVDYLIPDFGYLRERREQIVAVFLSHGHDDHVGAIPHFLNEFPVPVYGTPFTLELLDSRMKEVAPSHRNLLRRVPLGGGGEAGPFRFEFLRVPHSVPDSSAVAVETPGGMVFFTGDFKLDSNPVDGRLADEAGFARWGDRGVDLLCCDSTNAARSGWTRSERDVGLAFAGLLPQVSGRAYVATFSSHIHRMQQVIEVSRVAGRAVTFLGRSLSANVRSARRLGHLKAAPGDIIPETRAPAVPRQRLTVVLAGAQGEEGSALQRVAAGEDPRHCLLPGDEVFLSARVIPGYERAVGHLIDRCLEKGARVHVGEEAGIHASGHPSANDVLRMFDLLRPNYVLPVHGEYRHRRALAGLAGQWGVPAERILQGGNGQSLLLEDGRVSCGPKIATGRTFLECGRFGPAGDLLLRDRRRLGKRGVAVATAAIRCDGTLARGPRVSLRGVFPGALTRAAECEAEGALGRHLAGLDVLSCGTPGLEAEMKAVLRRHFRRLCTDTPLLVTQVEEIDSESGPPLQ